MAERLPGRRPAFRAAGGFDDGTIYVELLTLAAQFRQCDTVGMQSKPAPRKMEPPTLRQLMRRERRVWISLWSIALLILLSFSVILSLFPNDSNEQFSPAIAVLLIYALPIVGYLVFLSKRTNPGKTRSDLNHFLRRFGNVDRQINGIDSELRNAAEVHEFDYMPAGFRSASGGTILLTHSWLLSFAPESICFLRIQDIVWLFKRCEIHPRWWKANDRPTVRLSCLTDYGLLYDLAPGNDDSIDELMEFLTWRRPEALFGFTEQWRNLADEGMAAMRRQISNRRAEWDRLSPFQKGDWMEQLIDESIIYICRVDESISVENQVF
jgi:hypothetical protein